MDAEVFNAVIQRVDGEIAPPGVFLETAIDVVAQYPPAFIDQHGIITLLTGTAKSGHLDDMPAEMHMRQPEAAADQAAIGKRGPHLLGQGIGGHIEVLGLQAQQDIAHAAADQKCLVVGSLESIEHLERRGGDMGPGQRVFGSAHDHRADGISRRFGEMGIRKKILHAKAI